MSVKLKKCPLLVQSDTRSSNLVAGESWTRSYMVPCIKDGCSAFDWDFRRGCYCKMFDTRLEIHEDEEEDKHE